MKLFYLLLISLIFQLTNIPILSRGNSVNASENIEIKNSNDENNPVKTVIANGYGINIDDAAQNAAKNALTNVVGKFIDAETKLSKKVEIENGLVNQSKNIDRNIREYSQGSISYFEIIEINNIDGIFNLTARVDVKVDDFISYIKQIAYNLKDIDTGMFNEIKANIDNEDNKLDLYIEKVLKPILTGEVTEFEIGKALPFNKFPTERFTGSYWGYQVPEESDPMKMFVVPFSLKLNDAFKKNIKEVLNNLSEGKNSTITFKNWAKMNFTEEDLNPGKKVVGYRWSKNKKSMFHYMDLFRSKFSKNLSSNKPYENIYVGLVENNQNKVQLFSIPNLGLRIKNSEKYKKYYSKHIEKDKSRFSYYPQEKKISLVNHPFISSSEYFRSIRERKKFGLNTFFYNPIKLSLEDSSENVIYSCTISPISSTCKNVQIVMLSPDGSLGNDGAYPNISLLAGYYARSSASYKPRNNSNFIFSKRDYALVFNLDLELIKNINNIKIEHTKYLDN
ncbi:hypothetical protein N9V02_00165 [Prochlorococcus sp. AH-736-L23]|nr:hypothetical protein [Prochlorococcus sp. AH-736-L23]